MAARTCFAVTASALVSVLSLASFAFAGPNLLPNGGFEIAQRALPASIKAMSDGGFAFSDSDPLLPQGWRLVSRGASRLQVIEQSNSGKHALSLSVPKGSSVLLSAGSIEVVPGAKYSFGLSTRGSGKGKLIVYGQAFEGGRQLGVKEFTGGEKWTQVAGEFDATSVARRVYFEIEIAGPSELVLDNVFLWADLPASADVSSMLLNKPQQDADTIAFVDFDGKGEYRLESGATITDSGRFGKALRLDRKQASTAIIPLVMDKLPPEGTLEFWLSSDDDPSHIYGFMDLLAGSTVLMRVQADTANSCSAFWLVPGEGKPGKKYARSSRIYNRDFFRKGQWLHFAVQWDQEAVRFFVNGMLHQTVMQSSPTFLQTPSGIRLGCSASIYCFSGMIDEVRLSKVQRFGPFVPKGATWTPLAANQAPDAPAAKPAAVKSKPAPDFAAERLTDIAPIPNAPAGAKTFGPELVKPLVDSSPGYQIVKDKPVAGMTLARVGMTAWKLRQPDNHGGYWRLEGIEPGRYYIGVWYQSGKTGAEAIQGSYGAMNLYLNGRIVQLSTHSDPVQVAPGVYFAEAQAEDAVELKNGDEVGVIPGNHSLCHLARLTLYSKEPARGRGWIHTNLEGNWFRPETALRLNVEAAFLHNKGDALNGTFRHVQEMDTPSQLRLTADGTRAVAQCRINNPLSVPLTVELTATIQAFYREVVGEVKETLTLQPHQSIVREIPFTIVPDSRRYTIDARVQAINPPDLGWPAADTINYFRANPDSPVPGVRQSLPWPDPFSFKDQRSLQFNANLPGERMRFTLNGQWQTALTTDLVPPVPAPESLTWMPRMVPMESRTCLIDQIVPRPHGIYMRRTFKMPSKERQTCRLVITEVTDEATAYVNGKKVGNVRGAKTPMICDITDVLKEGDNELLIVVRDLLAIMNPDYVNPAAPVISNQYLDAPGLNGSKSLGLGHVTIEASPLIAASDLLIIPSVRNKQLSARFNVTSHTDQATKVKVVATVLDAGKPVLELGCSELELVPGKSVPLNYAAPWADPVMWGPGSPKLYTLSVETLDASGKRLDLMRTRFGFRETWIEKDNIIFNGYPIKPKASTVFGGHGVNIGDFTLSRGTRIPDYMDEWGHPLSLQVAGLSNTSSRHNVERDQFWEAARQNVLADAARLCNHPCIIAWDLSNEWLGFLDYGGGDPMMGARRFFELNKALKEFDPSRWSLFNGDGDLHGLHDNYAGHYLRPQGSLNRDFEMDGHAAFLPDGSFFRKLSEQFVPGKKIRLSATSGKLFPWGEKVLMNTENLWKVGRWMPPGLSKFVGEDDVLSPAIDSGRGPVAWMWKQNIDGHRDVGASAIYSYSGVAGVFRRGQMVQCFIMPDHTHHYFAGAKVARDYSLYNDKFVPSDFMFRWTLLDQAGKVIEQGQTEKKMATAELHRGQFSLNMPSVAARSVLTLRLELFADEKFAYGEDRDLEVWPSDPIAPERLVRKVMLFDPAGKTAGVLKQLNVETVALTDLKAFGGEPAKTLLIVAEGALTEKMDADAQAIAAFVSAGGRIVVLAQDRVLPGLPVRTSLESRQWDSQVFVRTPGHPALKGLNSWDLHFWSSDHVVSYGAYSRPEIGAFVCLADAGSDVGMEWTQLVEYYSGEGLILLCQLPLISKYDCEPMTRELLARILSYAGSDQSFLRPVRKLDVLCDGESNALKKLENLGVSCERKNLDAPVNASSTVMVDAAGIKPDFKTPAAWIKAIQEGATLIVHGATPDHRRLLSELAGTEVKLVAQPYAMWEGRAYRNGFTSLTPGLTHIDLYWKNYDGTERAVSQAEWPELKIDDAIHWSVSAANATEHIFPGGLVEIPVGKGRLVVDQMRWETSKDKLQRHSNRLVSSVMMGLGVKIDPYVAPRELPKDVKYQPVDIKAFANRGLADEVGDDGKGGWLDQGPKIDLKDFPTGRVILGGVPFQIGLPPHSCIVLKSNSRPFPNLQPDEVTIPLGMKLEGLCFLHGSGYGGPDIGLYQVQYADGSVFEIHLRENENLRDWISSPAGFAREKGTQSRVAWTGSTVVFPVVTIYQMLWVNPRPEAEVKAVRFSNPAKKACPGLLGLTAAVRGQASSDSPAQANKGKELFEQAMAAIGAGKDADARDLLQKAVQAEPTLDAAHQALGQLCEKLKDEDAALAAYRNWANAGARTPLPYNRIGEIMERKKDFKAAFEAYSQSLEIEWNQPPIIELKSRLQTLLNQK